MVAKGSESELTTVSEEILRISSKLASDVVGTIVPKIELSMKSMLFFGAASIVFDVAASPESL